MEEGGGSLDSLLFTKVGLITLIYFRVDRRRYPKDLISKFVGEKKYKKKLMDIPIKNSDIYIYTYFLYFSSSLFDVIIDVPSQLALI